MKKISLILALYFSSQTWAGSTYDDCLKQYDYINNAVVAACSARGSEQTSETIQDVLAQIYQQSLENDQPEKYKNILKSHQLWEKYMQIECDNAGSYIGSPMYEYCPMEKTAEQLENLRQYLN